MEYSSKHTEDPHHCEEKEERYITKRWTRPAGTDVEAAKDVILCLMFFEDIWVFLFLFFVNFGLFVFERLILFLSAACFCVCVCVCECTRSGGGGGG